MNEIIELAKQQWQQLIVTTISFIFPCLQIESNINAPNSHINAAIAVEVSFKHAQLGLSTEPCRPLEDGKRVRLPS